MDIVDAIKVEISGTGVITPKEEVKECDNDCGCKLPSVAVETQYEIEQ